MTDPPAGPVPESADTMADVESRRAVAELVESVIVNLDTNGRIRDIECGIPELSYIETENKIGEPIDRLFEDLSDEELQENQVEEIKEAIFGDATNGVMIECRDDNGGSCPIRIKGRPVAIDESSLVGLVVVLERVAEKEQRLERQREQLRLFNQIFRHDIRNDANLVLEIVSRIEQDWDDDQHNRLFEQLKEGSKRIVDLTERAREFISALEGAEESCQPTPLAPIIMEEIANASSISPDVTILLDSDPPQINVVANEMLGALFRNILSNAIHHNDANEPIVNVEFEVEETVVKIHFADNGPGMSAELREAAEHGDVLQDQTADAGLGLSIIYTLVDQYGGELTFADRESRGTRVSVTLPRADE